MIRRLVSRLLLLTVLLLPAVLFAQLQQLGWISGQIHVVGGRQVYGS